MVEDRELYFTSAGFGSNITLNPILRPEGGQDYFCTNNMEENTKKFVFYSRDPPVLPLESNANSTAQRWMSLHTSLDPNTLISSPKMYKTGTCQ
ncbi:hypothetical protein PoB_005710200 [Plakobranchus ocellatus]|uniref:Uncharacterized protein n=1 Tax=Plakobranchus ocellatus TaxID=259542 RepID=A0AAV4CG69_9GAST|nr:hypothetical protein PoB_005710200 [Plakobranchus ocellatus]